MRKLDDELVSIKRGAQRAYAHWCGAPIKDIRRLIAYLEHDEERNFTESPQPDHIRWSVCRVRDWVDDINPV